MLSPPNLTKSVLSLSLPHTNTFGKPLPTLCHLTYCLLSEMTKLNFHCCWTFLQDFHWSRQYTRLQKLIWLFGSFYWWGASWQNMHETLLYINKVTIWHDTFMLNSSVTWYALPATVAKSPVFYITRYYQGGYFTWLS